MLITYDTEFIDDGKKIELLSIGMVAENGDELYRIVEDADWSRALTWGGERPSGGGWLAQNVIEPHLPIRRKLIGQQLLFIGADLNRDHPDCRFVQPRNNVARDVERFLRAHAGVKANEEIGPDAVPDLWAYYPATDHVALYQLFGPMIECTSHGMPMRTSCLKQEEESFLRRYRQALAVDRLSDRLRADWDNARPKQDPATEHHALHDARHDMALARWLGLTS